MKEKGEYLKRVRKNLDTKPNGGIIIKRIVICVISLLPCYVEFLDWNTLELEEIHSRT